MDSNSRSIVTIPGAIILAGALIAMSVIWINRPANSGTPAETRKTPNPLQQVNMAAVTSKDHILGNPDASIKIVEFSDPSCPYCKVFNATMVQIMNEYGPTGNVAWVYRSFPLNVPDENGNILHPNAGRESEALECAASLGGNDKFWAYEKEWYKVVPDEGANRSASDDQKQLAQIAADVGLNAVAFNDCIASGQFKSKILAEYTDGLNAGVSGTPTSFILTPSGNTITLPGVVAYGNLKNAIDTLLSGGSSSGGTNTDASSN